METFKIPNILEVGIDEAGRGPMFGPLYAGAVILPPDFKDPLIKDSKKLTPRKGLMAMDIIKENAIDYNVASIDEKKIDEINIFNATIKCMHKALDGLRVIPEHILVDGPYFKTYFNNKTFIPYTCIEGGDNQYTSIASASILAKIYHDQYIERLCDENPKLEELYNLRKNKGYGTKQHLEGIKKYGITQWHRKSFGICKNY